MSFISTLDELVLKAKELPTRKVSVVRADEVETLKAIAEAMKYDLVIPILVGPQKEIRKAAEQAELDLSGIELIQAEEDTEAAEKGVEIVRNGDADMIMKGLVASSSYMRSIMKKETGLRGPGVLSHVAVFEVPGYHKLITVTDAAMNIAPKFPMICEELRNAQIVTNSLGIAPAKATFICAKEKVYDKMPRTLEAAEIKKLAEQGEFGDIIFDAPLALDNAVSKNACTIKGIDSPVGGDVDIMVFPDIESGNIFYKSIIFIAGGTLGAVIMGATKPVILTSRADPASCKFYSLALAAVIADYQAENN